MPKNSFLERIKKLNKSYQKENEMKDVPKQAGSTLYSAASKLVNNRILDLYLKALGITVLTPTTLVPLALVMGATTFKDTVGDILALEKAAGKSKSKKSKKTNDKDGVYIPIIDDAVFGTYTKYTGAAVQLALSPFTLIPIGVAIAVYEFYGYLTNTDTQVGGGSNQLASLMSIGPVNSANVWTPQGAGLNLFANHEPTSADMQKITGYALPQEPNTTLKIEAAPEPLDGLGAGSFVGGKRKSKGKKQSKRNERRMSKKRINDMYRRSRSRPRRSKKRR